MQVGQLVSALPALQASCQPPEAGPRWTEPFLLSRLHSWVVETKQQALSQRGRGRRTAEAAWGPVCPQEPPRCSVCGGADCSCQPGWLWQSAGMVGRREAGKQGREAEERELGLGSTSQAVFLLYCGDW